MDVDAVVFEPIIDDGGGGGGGGPPLPPTQKEVGKKTKAPPPSSSSSFGNGIFLILIKSYDEFDASEGLTKLKRNVKHSDRMAKAMQYKAGKVAKSLRVKVNGTTNANARKSVGVLSRTRTTRRGPAVGGRRRRPDARSTLKKKKKKTPGKTSKEKSKEASKIPVTYPDATKPEIYKFNDAERRLWVSWTRDEILRGRIPNESWSVSLLRYLPNRSNANVDYSKPPVIFIPGCASNAYTFDVDAKDGFSMPRLCAKTKQRSLDL